MHIGQIFDSEPRRLLLAGNKHIARFQHELVLPECVGATSVERGLDPDLHVSDVVCGTV